MAATELRKLGWPGKGSFEFEPPRDGLAPTYTVSGSFELEARPEFIEGKAFAPPQRSQCWFARANFCSAPGRFDGIRLRSQVRTGSALEEVGFKLSVTGCVN
jgi:hypothetical protein